jgi:hypothetical protein
MPDPDLDTDTNTGTDDQTVATDTGVQSRPTRSSQKAASR